MRLKVKNFSCLKNIDIHLDDLTIIIGEQASGKSLTCKLYFYFREVLTNQFINAINEEDDWRMFQTKAKSEFHKLFHEYIWKEQNFKISLEDNSGIFGVEITHESNKKGINFSFSNVFKEKFKEIKKCYFQLKESSEKENKQHFSLDTTSFKLIVKAIQETKSEDLLEDVTYVPSGRSFFSTIKKNVFGFLSENIGIDPFLISFGKYYEFSKRINTDKNNDGEIFKEFDNFSQSILKGQYDSDKKDEWIISNDKKISISHASSGQQEALPLLMVLRTMLFIRSGFTPLQSLVVEEPEAHLFPTSQKMVVDLLFFTQQHSDASKFLITTHSPYILSCCNNNILKYKNKVNVNAYLISNGESIRIMDTETGLIDGTELDKISSDIANEFYAALEEIDQ